MFHGIHAIVKWEQWLPHEAVSVYDALKMYTINAAVCAFEERVKGTIEVGKFADVIVVDQDPLSMDPQHLKDIKVIMTFFGGTRAVKGSDTL